MAERDQHLQGLSSRSWLITVCEGCGEQVGVTGHARSCPGAEEVEVHVCTVAAADALAANLAAIAAHHGHTAECRCTWCRALAAYSAGQDPKPAPDLAEAIALLRGSVPIFEKEEACGNWWRRWGALVGRYTDDEDGVCFHYTCPDEECRQGLRSRAGHDPKPEGDE